MLFLFLSTLAFAESPFSSHVCKPPACTIKTDTLVHKKGDDEIRSLRAESEEFKSGSYKTHEEYKEKVKHSAAGLWLVRRKSKLAVHTCLRILDQSEAGGMDEYEGFQPVTFEEPNIIKVNSHNRYTSANYRYQLDPLKPVSMDYDASPSAGGAVQVYDKHDWNYAVGTGIGTRGFNGESIAAKGKPKTLNSYLPIPILHGDELPWNTASLGTCGVGLDNGFILQGKEKSSRKVKTALVAGGKYPWSALILQVSGSGFITGSRNWLHDDHFEFWIGQQTFDGMLGEIAPMQWGLRVSDGKIYPAHNAQGIHPTVKTADIPGGKAFYVDLSNIVPLFWGGDGAKAGLTLAVSYSESDHGKKVKSLVSSAKVIFANPNSLGCAVNIESPVIKCELENGALTPKIVEPVKAPGGCTL